MKEHFFSGAHYTRLDDKNRFVLPQSLRYGLVEGGELSFTLCLGLGGSLAIYGRSEMEKIVSAFRARQHLARYQKFFTLFFSTLHHLTCDKLGRVLLPAVLKQAASIRDEIVVCGVMHKIEIWPREKYESDLEKLWVGQDATLLPLMEEAFSLLAPPEGPSASLEKELLERGGSDG